MSFEDSGREVLSSRNCCTVRPLYLMPARRWQSWSCCLTVSTVSSFFVRLMAARIEMGLWEKRGFLVLVVMRRGFLKWDFRDRV